MNLYGGYRVLYVEFISMYTRNQIHKKSKARLSGDGQNFMTELSKGKRYFTAGGDICCQTTVLRLGRSQAWVWREEASVSSKCGHPNSFQSTTQKWVTFHVEFLEFKPMWLTQTWHRTKISIALSTQWATASSSCHHKIFWRPSLIPRFSITIKYNPVRLSTRPKYIGARERVKMGENGRQADREVEIGERINCN